MRREAPWVAYELETEVRFWKADRPTPRRVDIFLVKKIGLGGLNRENFSLCERVWWARPITWIYPYRVEKSIHR